MEQMDLKFWVVKDVREQLKIYTNTIGADKQFLFRLLRLTPSYKERYYKSSCYFVKIFDIRNNQEQQSLKPSNVIH